MCIRGSRIVHVLESAAATTGFSAALYYLFLSSAFRREQKAVLQGKVQYRHSLNVPGRSSYLLRRNIHRLEKGLIMEPRRPVFARRYIGETVAAYATWCRNGDPGSTADTRQPEHGWARGVLDEYFSVVLSDEPKIARARDMYESVRGSTDGSVGPKPYAAAELASVPVSPESFRELCRIRRSVRWFDPTPVPREAVDRAIESAGTAPSACNRQPFEYLIFDKPDLVKRIGAIPGGTAGFSQNFPAVAVLVGDLGAYFDERDRHLIYIDGSLSAMTFLLALQAEGLSTCSINWPDVAGRERAMREAVQLPEYKRIVMLIAIGYARGAGLIPVSIKKPVDQLRSFNDLKG